MVASGASRRALVVGADVMSSIIDYTDRTTCVLFGDGAGACVVEVSDADDVGIIDFENYVDGSGGPALCMPAGGSRMPASRDTIDQRLHFVKQDGQTVFKFAVRNMEEVCRRILERNRLSPDDVDLFVPHQASSRIIHAAAEKLKPLYLRLLQRVANSDIVLADETTLAMQNKKRGYMWTFRTDKLVSYKFSAGRSGKTPREVLGGSKGTLLVDEFTGYNLVVDVDGRKRAACLAHVRRKFFDALPTAPEA